MQGVLRSINYRFCDVLNPNNGLLHWIHEKQADGLESFNAMAAAFFFFLRRQPTYEESRLLQMLNSFQVGTNMWTSMRHVFIPYDLGTYEHRLKSRGTLK